MENYSIRETPEIMAVENTYSFIVNTYTTLYQKDSQIVALEDGGFLIVWGGRGVSPLGGAVDGIFAQRYDASANPSGNQFMLKELPAFGGDFGAANPDIVYYSITALKDGGWILVYHDPITSSIAFDRFNSQGTYVYPSGNLSGVPTSSQIANTSSGVNPKVTTLADGGWLISYQEGNAISGARYNSSGVNVGTILDIGLTESSSFIIDYEIAALENGGWVSFWDMGGGRDGNRVKQFNSNGTSLDPTTVTIYRMEQPYVASLSDGGWIVVWSGSNVAGENDIYARRYNSAGVPGGTFLVNSYTADAQTNPVVIGLSDGGWVIAWESSGSIRNNTFYGLYAKRYNSSGNVVKDEFFINTPSTTGFYAGDVLPARDIDLAVLSDGTLVATWNAWTNNSGDNKADIVARVLLDNDPTVAASQTVSTAEDTAATVTVTGSDVDGDSLTYTAGAASNGTVTGGAGGVFSYTPKSNYVGLDSFIVTVSDGNGGSTTQTVNVTVTNVDEEATGTLSVTGTVQQGGSLTASLTAATDPDGAITGTAYQWQISMDGNTWTNISGATSATYALASDQTQVGQFLRAAVITTDALGGTSILTGQAAQIANVNDAPVPTTLPTGEYLVNTTTIYNQSTARIAVLSDGGWVISWTSTNQDGSLGGIYGQRYASSGEPVGSEFKVNTYTVDDQIQSWVSGTSDGGWIVVWASNGQDGSSFGIYGQRYDMAGQPVGAEFRVNTSTNSMQTHPTIEVLGAGGWIVAWSSFGQDGSNYGIYAQRYDSFGRLIGNEVRINSYTASNQTRPSVTSLADGGWLVTWESLDQDGSYHGIYGQRYDLNGTPVGVEFQVNTTTLDNQYYSTVEVLPDGGWLVVWSSVDPGWTNNQIMGQRYDVNGNKVGSEFIANPTPINYLSLAGVTVLEDGGWVIVWSTGNQDSEVVGQRYDSSGQKVGNVFQINTTADGEQGGRSIAALPDGGWVVTWVSYGQDGSGYGVYSQRFDVNGNFVSTSLDQVSAEDKAWSYTLPANTFMDVDGDALTYSAKLANGDKLPTWLLFNAETRTFSGKPPQNFNGNISLTITASDGSLTASDTFVLIVNAVEDEATGTLSVTGTAQEGGSLTASLTGATDPDGAITGTAYQWQISSNGNTWTNISGATSTTYNLASDQSQVGKYVRVVVTTTDALGGTTVFTGNSSAAITNVNDALSGAVTLSGLANERQTLSAVTGGLSDPDGLGSFSYQWQSSTDGVLWSAISGATGSSYALTTADIGSQVRVVVSYTDGFGTAESVTSGASAVVAELVVNEVSGTSGADTLTGVSGVVNVYTGGAGNDTITGKDRADVAVYTGNRSDYTVTTVAGVMTVKDNRPGSPDGTDTVKGMNILRFADSQLFVTAAANRTTLAGVAQTFEVANSEFVTGTAAAEQFIIHSGVSAFVSAGTGDTVDLSGAITDYTYKASGNQLQISDGVNTTVLTVGGAFTLRTASGSTSVVLDFAAGGVIKLGTQVVGSAGFDAAAAITNAGNTSVAEQGVSTTPPTVTALTGSSASAPTLTGTAVIGEDQTLEVTVNGVTYTTATGVVLGAGNTWSLTLPSALPAGTYNVEAVIVPGVNTLNPVSGTSGADTLTGVSGVVNVYTGGAGNDTITGKDRADVAVYTGNRSDYTVTTVAGVVTVKDNRPGSPDGTDTVKGMNILRFADSQLFVTAAANRTTLAGVAQTFEVANSEFVTGTAAAEQFIIHSGVSAFVSAGTGDTVDLSGAITDYTYKASGNQLQISDGVNTTVLTVGGAFTLRTASGSTSVVLDFAAGGVIKLGTQVVGSAGFDAAAAITNAGNVSDNAIPAFIADTSSNELVINDPVTVIANGGVYTAITGKVDTFVIDANQTITATIIGFEEGDIIEILNSSESLGINFDNTVFDDGNATIFISASAILNLRELDNDLFADEVSFENVYGPTAITYVM